MSYQQKIVTGVTPFPDKPEFYGYLPATDSNVTGNGTVYRLGESALTLVINSGDFATNGWKLSFYMWFFCF